MDQAEATATSSAAPTTDDSGMMTDDAFFAQYGDETPKADTREESTAEDPKPDPVTEKAEKSDKPETPAAEPKRDPAPAPLSPDIQKAMRALQRDGLSAKAIERMLKEDPEDFVKTGLKRSKAQADADRFGSEFGETKKRLAELEKLKSEAPKPNPTRQQLVTPEIREAYPELSGVFDAFEQRLGGLQETFDARLAEALGPALEQVNGRVNFAMQRAVEQEIKAARSELESTFPRLKDSDEFAEVKEEAAKLLKSGMAEDVREAMQKASQLRYFQELVESGQRARQQLTTAKNAGQPAQVTNASTAAKAMKSEDRDTEWLRIAETKGVQAANAWLDSTSAG